MDTLGQIFSSNVRAEFFRLFFRGDKKELHLREIGRRSNFVTETVRLEALRLSRLGFIRVRRDGMRVFFSANTEHPFFDDISTLVLRTSGPVDVIRRALQGADISYTFVFGSAAALERKPECDIDLFVIGNTGVRHINKLLQRASKQLRREINTTVMTEDEFCKRRGRKKRFVTSIMKSAKLMIIGKEDELTRLGK